MTSVEMINRIAMIWPQHILYIVNAVGGLFLDSPYNRPVKAQHFAHL